MTEASFNLLIWIWIALAVVLFPLQLFVTAPYGRHVSDRWGPRVDNRLGWIVMEAVSPAIFAASFLWGGVPGESVVWLFFALWIAHYVHRSFVFPLRTRTSGKQIPIVIVVFAIMFNAMNGWTNGTYLGSAWGDYSGWFSDPRLWIGLAIFALGAWINITSDNHLIGLRRGSGDGYSIPHGGWFERVSCPNHLGEIIQWTGFAIMCWNLPALAFAIWTAANLIPRAISHHRWYNRTFDTYPASRRAVIPGLI